MSAPARRAGRAPDPWLRQPTDTPRSWEAFITYRDLGLNRSLQKVADALQKQGSVIRRWAVQHSWASRAQAFDADQDEQIQRRMLSSRYRVAERHAQLARRAQSILLDAFASVDPTTLSPADMAAWLRVSVAIEREVYFPKDSPDVQVNAVAQIIIDPRLVTPPTLQARPWVDADREQA